VGAADPSLDAPAGAALALDRAELLHAGRAGGVHVRLGCRSGYGGAGGSPNRHGLGRLRGVEV
jgi:hypothetical protein